MGLTNHKKVILLKESEPELWRFFDFTYSNGNNPIQDWYDGLSDLGRGRVDAMLKTNQKTELPLKWTGFRKYLKGEMSGIWELGFYDDVQYRLLGIFNGAKRAVFLMGCYHKAKNYTPPDALATALKRKSLWQTGACIKSNERPVKTDQ